MKWGKRRRGISVLGSTGSIGTSTMEVLDVLRDRFEVVALAAGSNRNLLQEQIERYKPQYASLAAGGSRLNGVKYVDSPDALTFLATLAEIEIVVVATTGHDGIRATIAALQAGKIVAIANKETIIAAGEIVMREAQNGPGELRPVDSEHSAIWQCLDGRAFDPRSMRRIILTASGGPFRGMTRKQLEDIQTTDALNHPTWTMGAKITIDSATLMNKGFELIEASWLFSCPMNYLDIIVHPQSIIHSMVEFTDGAIIAQFGSHDMRIPIQYALTYPERLEGPGKRLDISTLSHLDFEPPDLETFPAISIARHAASLGSTYPAVLSSADTVAVNAFLGKKIGFLDICSVISETLDAHVSASEPLTLKGIEAADNWARRYAETLIARRMLS